MLGVRERERERERERLCVCQREAERERGRERETYIYIYVFIYTYVCRDNMIEEQRETESGRQTDRANLNRMVLHERCAMIRAT